MLCTRRLRVRSHSLPDSGAPLSEGRREPLSEEKRALLMLARAMMGRLKAGAAEAARGASADDAWLWEAVGAMAGRSCEEATGGGCDSCAMLPFGRETAAPQLPAAAEVE